MQADAEHAWPWPPRYEFYETTRLLRTGRNDPTLRREPDGLWRTARLPSGPVTVRIRVAPGERIEARAWGEGAAEAIERVPGWCGFDRPAWSLPAHEVTDRLLRDHPGLRLTDCGDVFESVVNLALQQQVTWNEAAFFWRRLVEAFGTTAPGPAPLRLVPTPRALRAAGVERLMRLGIGRQRAVTLTEAAFSARGLQRAAALPTDQAAGLLQRLPGLGPWTAAMVLGQRLARPEPVVYGDIHLPHTVCWALAGEPRGSEAHMARLLAPFPGQAFQVVRLLFAARIEAPRRGPRHRIRFGRGR